jgi:murein L,D-transpeptidase YcbB/YkuD
VRRRFNRSAPDGGDATDALQRGRLLADKGDLAAAAAAYRRADKRGDPAAATSLGVLLEQQGDLAGAAAAYRRASQRGDPAAAVNLGGLLARHDDVIGAETAYRRAAELGDDRAVDRPANPRIKRLQALLSFLEFDPGPADGIYGPRTTAAVTRFQAARDLQIDGVLGPRTEEALRMILETPTDDRVERVKALQRQLIALGFEPGPVDGRYGPHTTEAVKRFQHAYDLRVDGVADSLTRRALEHYALF